MTRRGHDVIVVGARVAGAATSLLLARAGLRVLTVDRVRFPSDTLSTHQVQVPGVARLHAWGLLDRLVATGTPPTRQVRFDAGHVVLDGRFPAYGGVDALYSPRRTNLDSILVEAARAAGAEVREGFTVEELVRDDDGAVTGIRGRQRGGVQVTETARLVIGADGKRSMVAAAVGAAHYRQRPAATLACYTYWRGVSVAGGRMYQRPGRAAAAFPTDDDLTMIYVAAPAAEFPTFRTDVEGHYLRTLDGCGDLGERVRAGERAERFRTTPDLPNTFRVPHGPGWALVGDAGLVMDPITAQGIGNALHQAELLAEAVVAGLAGGGGPANRGGLAGGGGPANRGGLAGGGPRSLAAALADYRRRRDAALRPMYDFTVGVAALAPPRPVDRHLLAALAGRPEEIDRFFGVFAGVTPIRRYRSARNALRLLGLRGLARAAAETVGAVPRG